MTNAQYVRAVEVAKRNNLQGETMPRFVKFLVEWSDLRGKDWTIDDGYNDEWAERFRQEKEYVIADGDAIIALVHIDGEKKAIEYATTQIKKITGARKGEAEISAKKKIKNAFENCKLPIPKSLQGYRVKSIKKDAFTKMVGEVPNINIKKLI